MDEEGQESGNEDVQVGFQLSIRGNSKVSSPLMRKVRRLGMKMYKLEQAYDLTSKGIMKRPMKQRIVRDEVVRASKSIVVEVSTSVRLAFGTLVQEQISKLPNN
ncbi:hypothetical protein AMTR_s00126p00124900 [Amborella trichopoda]|uniref:Uncharacterized protein n=1 Tax=Amborella trichopoda TaxID=13333 RepID=W1NMR5_AMBTC|nr:hypothetical protein AMTR_s00126p00124900 [Amborella trichopoda]